MENSLFLALSPFIVSFLTGFLKNKLNLRAKLTDVSRRAVMRLVVAILSFVAAIGAAALAGNEIDHSTVQSFVEAIMVFFSSSGIYFFTRK